MTRIPALREIAALVLFTAIAVIVTWPLARLLPTAVAYPGDPLINAWVLSWDVHALTHDPSNIFHANIFFPARYALTFSENLFGLLPLALPLSLVATPLTVHNILLIAGIAFSAWGAFVLGRVATGSVLAGVVAAIVYGYVPWRVVHLSHLQHAWGGWLPLLVAAILHFDRRRDRRSAVMIAGAFVMNGLTNLHYLVFGAVLAAAVAGAVALRSRERLATLVAALVLPALLLTAILWPYRVAHDLYSVRGDAAETDLYTASLRDWVAPGEGEPERRVFPGYIAIALAAIGCVSRGPRTVKASAVALLAIGVVFSLGRATPLYAFAFDHSSAISGIRAPARWAVVAYVGMTLLAALAVANRRAVVAIGAAALALAQLYPSSVRWFLMPEESGPVYRWLAKSDVQGGVLELPVGESDRDFYYLAGAAVHHKPIFNGASGGAPPVYLEVRDLFAADVIATDAVDTIRRLGGSTVVVHADSVRPAVREWIRLALQRGELAYVTHFDAGLKGDFVFSLGGGQPRRDAALASFLADEHIPPAGRPFGFLEAPAANTDSAGALKVRGWALSSAGIRTVRLWFANRSCSIDAELSPYPGLQRAFPGHSTETARFSASIAARPCGGEANDLLVQLIDHAGRRSTLPHVWIRWRD